MKLEKWMLRQKQALPLELKEHLSIHKIRSWYNGNRGAVFVSFSAGKDSSVLLHLARRAVPGILAVFSDTGLEFPENKELVRNTPNCAIVRPEKPFTRVIAEEGWPIIDRFHSKAIRMIQNPSEKNARSRRLYLTGIHPRTGEPMKRYRITNKWRFAINAPFKVSDKCCAIMKERPLDRFAKANGLAGMDGIMAGESSAREMAWVRGGCLNFEKKQAHPIIFWTEEDIWTYIRKHNVPYSKAYDMGYDRTGCIFCALGLEFDPSPNRFELLRQTHPKLWHYAMFKLGLAEVLEFLGMDYGLEEEFR
jgi:3'-phosphoadenosine 5'-phosphosulfate sulfotransferase (PAPS reductase)/FAD synthetase